MLDGALCVGVFTALAPGLVGLLLVDRHLEALRPGLRRRSAIDAGWDETRMTLNLARARLSVGGL